MLPAIISALMVRRNKSRAESPPKTRGVGEGFRTPNQSALKARPVPLDANQGISVSCRETPRGTFQAPHAGWVPAWPSSSGFLWKARPGDCGQDK